MTAPDLSHIIEPLRALAVPIAKLSPDPENARKHSQQNLDAIKASLRDNNQYLPLIVQEEGMIVRVGNGRLQAAKELGWTHIACAVVPMERVDAVKLALADNRTSELAEWDFEVLSSLLQELHSNEGDRVMELGWSGPELEPLLNASWSPPAIDDDVEFESSSGGAGNKSKDKTKGDVDTRVLVFSKDQWMRLQAALVLPDETPNDDIIAALLDVIETVEE